MNGYESARQVTKTHGRSFSFAAFALERDRRNTAYAVYAFFRRLDDAFDVAVGSDLVLLTAQQVINWLFNAAAPAVAQRIWPQDELEALRESIAKHGLPRRPFDEMVAGMQMDLQDTQYQDEATLRLYCDRVAGTVGEIMCTLLESQDREAATALGRAMQLTNILRDVKEDQERGRVYLPAALLQAHGVERIEPGETWRQLAKTYVAKTREEYALARSGTRNIKTLSGRWLVEMMARIYGDILTVIERSDYDVFKQRARVSWPRKLWLMCVALVAAVRR